MFFLQFFFVMSFFWMICIFFFLQLFSFFPEHFSGLLGNLKIYQILGKIFFVTKRLCHFYPFFFTNNSHSFFSFSKNSVFFLKLIEVISCYTCTFKTEVHPEPDSCCADWDTNLERGTILAEQLIPAKCNALRVPYSRTPHPEGCFRLGGGFWFE